jgi:hypothetical protein
MPAAAASSYDLAQGVDGMPTTRTARQRRRCWRVPLRWAAVSGDRGEVDGMRVGTSNWPTDFWLGWGSRVRLRLARRSWLISERPLHPDELPGGVAFLFQGIAKPAQGHGPS